MIAPLRAISVGSSAWVSVTSAVMLVSIIVRQSSRLARCAGSVPWARPALLTSRSMSRKPSGSASSAACIAACVADVERGGVHLVGAELVDQRLQAFGAAAGGDHAPAGGDETLRGGGAEAGGGAGDECGLGHAGFQQARR